MANKISGASAAPKSSQTSLQERADKAISRMIMKPVMDRAIKNINRGVKKFREATQGG